MTLKIGINGFGRIGRMVLRSIIEQNRKELEVVAINNKANTEISSFLLANDSVHGKLKLNTDLSWTDHTIHLNKKIITMTRETEISKIGFKMLSLVKPLPTPWQQNHLEGLRCLGMTLLDPKIGNL